MWDTIDQIELHPDNTGEGREPVDKISAVKSKIRLLLVEDEPLSQKYCQVLLQGCGYQLDIAGCGKTALAYIEQHAYESILMDVGLPDGSGIEVARVIRTTDNPNRHIPIIAFTAHLDSIKEQACLEAGMTAFLLKPVSPNELCDKLTEVLAAVA